VPDLIYYGPIWPAYVLRRGPFSARLVFSNEKAWLPAWQYQTTIENNGFQTFMEKGQRQTK